MKKLLAIGITLMLAFALAACSTGKTTNGKTNAPALSNTDIPAAAEGNTVSAEAVQDEANEPIAVLSGLPAGFPQSMPIYNGAQILEADAYGEHGYTVIYMASVPYQTVVNFYQNAFPDIEKIYDEPDECYFENFDIGGGAVHINGLTITDDDDYTTVFITLKYN